MKLKQLKTDSYKIIKFSQRNIAIKEGDNSSM